MFDFIEEPSTQSVPPPKDAIPKPAAPEGVIYTMPEKFHQNSQGNLPKPIVFGVLGIVVLAVLGTVLYLLLGTGNNQSPIAQVPIKQTNPIQPPQEPIAPAQTPVVEQPVTQPAQPPVTEQVPPSAPTISATEFVSSVDTDGDGLTDMEERMYGTDAQKPDTDGDSFIDGNEVKFLYDPIKPTPAKLELSGLVNTYKNPTFKYVLLYPTSWVVKAINKDNREVLFTSSTGESVSVTVQDNPEKLSSLDWYSTVKMPGVDASKLQTLTFDSWSGVMSADNLSAYLTAKNDKNKVALPYVVVISYDRGTQKELNYQTSFQMITRSFYFTDFSFVK